MTHIRSIAIAVFLIATLSGCASISTAIKDVNQMLEKSAVEARGRALANVQDPHLVNALYSISADGKSDSLLPSIEAMGFEVFRVEKSALILRRQDGYRGNMQELARDVAMQTKDAERDAVSGEFIQAARARGSEVRVYRPALMQRINGLFEQPFQPKEKAAQWYNRDVVLVEFDDSNRPLSLIARAYQAETMMGVTLYQYVQVLYGTQNMLHFENNVSGRMLDDNYLRTYK